MNRILIVFAHPRFEKSRANRALLAGIDGLKGVTVDDLYEAYPDFDIDIEREQTLLTDHDVIVWHFPFYTYGAPALFKQWMDVVLEYGWAHGGGGSALTDKTVFVALTAGGTRESYADGQHNRFPLRDFLKPFEQTAALCRMVYLPPYAVHGTHRLTGEQLAGHGRLYRRLLRRFAAGEFDADAVRRYDYLDNWLDEQGWT